MGFLKFSECYITNEKRLAYLPEKTESVIVFAIPYYNKPKGDGNISLYAVPEDYHYFINGFEKELIPKLKSAFENNAFYLAADKSPIDERSAGAKAGIGIIGENSLLITKKYSSFVFIAEVFTDLYLESEAKDIEFCEKCGRCKKACPAESECLSQITQKKGTLSKKEGDLMRKYNTAWGCDICSIVCPHSENIEETKMEFFRKNLIFDLDKKTLDSMDKDEFSRRAFSWRTKKVIERNLLMMKKTNVLFIGNSYTFFNDLPKLFEDLSISNGFDCKSYSVTRGGWKLSLHLDKSSDEYSKIVSILSNENIDYTVMQDHSMIALKEPDNFNSSVKEMAELVRLHNSAPILYGTWPRHKDSPDLIKENTSAEKMKDAIDKAYSKASRDYDIPLAKTCDLFYEIENEGKVSLYNEDKTHPSYAGSYLNTCLIFKAIYGISPSHPLESALETLGGDIEDYLRNKASK